MATEHTPATGTYTTNGTPNGYTSVTPHLNLADPAAAISFYESAFGARVCSITKFDGMIAHAELEFGNGRLSLGLAMPAYNTQAPDPDAETVTFSLLYYCPNVDDVAGRAADLGAKSVEPVTTFVSGDRYVTFHDPFGIRWNVRTRVEDLSDEESQQRVNAWIASQG